MMAEGMSFRISPKVLEWARLSMGYTIEQAAKKASVAPDKYELWETGQKTPTYRQLETLAENVFKRPLAILLLPEPPNEDPIQKDFRNLSNADVIELSPELRLALRKAKRYQLILDEVAAMEAPPEFLSFKVTLSDDPATAAGRFRQFLRLSIDEQKSWKYDDALRNFKQLVERIGIYVFQLKIPMHDARAFCLTGRFPIVVLNTEDSNNGRIFSLFHEVCHVLFNINDLFKDSNTGQLNKDYETIEAFCNQFAASFLVPEEYFVSDLKFYGISKDNISDYDIQRISRSYNVSNEVIARKLLSYQLISETFFWARKKLWDAAARSARERQKEKMKDHDSGLNQGIKIVFEKGKPYVSSVVNAYHQGLISSADLSNYLETKLNNLPKIIERLSN
jgi:Zn-dependent peptidase ImmA (M78 family)